MQGLNSVMRTLLPHFLEQERKKSRALSHTAYVRAVHVAAKRGSKRKGVGEEKKQVKG